ncbi:hypothetical protein EFY87_12235 [Flexivirga caeni]|uniref:Uncharacterized protein n=2 Tax=Flexivirga caeni TaxID=2294115 RepID=A0A3M9M679_9MICO|nr:hypothetical protein EFY87_12235 [Flexivirga caeni]
MTAAPAPPRLAQLRPPQVVTATRLMYAGLLLALIGVLVNARSKPAIVRALKHTNARRSPGDRLSGANLQHAANLTYAAFVVMSVLAVLCWLLMAVTVSRGQSWARLVATVLAGMNLLLTIGMATRGTAAAAIAEAPTVLVGAAVVWLLWQPPSNRFFDDAAALRSARAATTSGR